jgi:hypothetical protein
LNQAVIKGIGVPVITDTRFGRTTLRRSSASRRNGPKPTDNDLAVIKALIRVVMWLDANGNANRPKRSRYSRDRSTSGDAAVIANR